jgi:hypothetical protein
MSIGWEFVQKQALQIDVYEKVPSPLFMIRITRKSMLRNVNDVPAEDIRAAEQQVQKIQRQRLQTVNQGKASRVKSRRECHAACQTLDSSYLFERSPA